VTLLRAHVPGDERPLRRSSKLYDYGELPLTAIEILTVRMLVEGAKLGEIANKRGVSKSTVKQTLQRAQEKLGARTRAQMAALFVTGRR